MIKAIIKIIMCHLVGDYVLQTDFIATSKGSNWYHLIVHCILYVLPFCITFEFGYELLLLFITHIIIDALKARYKKIGYSLDQILHYAIAFMLYLVI